LISTLRAYCPEACLLGLTATASQAVLNDLKVEFENDGSGIKALQSMDRKELNFRRVIIHSNHERKEFIQNVLRENGGTYEDNKGVSKNRVGLVFCPTVKGKNTGCLEIQNALLKSTQFKQRVEAYHGQLSMEKRGEIQRKFMSADYTGALVCTKAFGMGIDKENVKYTIHVSLPQSIESFYQEAG
jgi:ATP-dependent DNA helicase RecQ